MIGIKPILCLEIHSISFQLSLHLALNSLMKTLCLLNIYLKVVVIEVILAIKINNNFLSNNYNNNNNLLHHKHSNNKINNNK